MEFETIDILDLLPQRPPFVMLDRLLYCDGDTTQTAFVVKDSNIFCDNGHLSEAGLIENIAQTCAARMGYINTCTDAGNGSVKLGFIGSIRDMEIFRLPAVGETLLTQVNVEEEVFQMTLVNATVTAGNEPIASGAMKIAIGS
ncbi:MAG: pseudouridylate synthase [Dysgonamonadaceae bacterium]|jgi:predicted hotdog family 3-hydroxylacyl-ACP dehydratase|nr:pseudouridylate synthase [Dysgonamonadaceae bacterium]